MTPRGSSPAALGFRMPAEWEPHEATWLGWPHNRTDWPGKFAPIPWVYGEIVRRLAPGETVRILVGAPAPEAGAVRGDGTRSRGGARGRRHRRERARHADHH